MITELNPLSLIEFSLLGLFAYRRLLRYLHMLQQDDYDNFRFFKWIFKTGSFDKTLSITILILSVLFGYVEFGINQDVPHYALSLLFAFFVLREKNPSKLGKKVLVFTHRVKRILAVAVSLALVAAFFVVDTSVFESSTAAYFLFVQAVPVLLILANLMLVPVEASIQRSFRQEAEAKLRAIAPAIIGITGSFGKTSVKHILGHVLELNAQTLFTPGSVNTLMGIVRIIREKMMRNCAFFVVEMGAYGKGSVKRLCEFTPPQIGIITALGEAHYERFKTLDAVAKAKFELAEAVLKHEGGRIIIHEDILLQEYARAFVDRCPERFVVCGRGEKCDLKMLCVLQEKDGLYLDVHWQGHDYALFAPLYGVQHAENMALAFAAAAVAGIEPHKIVEACRLVPQIQHRLEVKPHANGTVFIDDAYNSNPKGFAAALSLLSFLAEGEMGRRILITPGIVELGARHDLVHADLGLKALENADIVLAVRPDRIPTFCEFFQKNGEGKTFVPVSSFQEAELWLTKNIQPNDIVLFENDLPDVYEKKLSM